MNKKTSNRKNKCQISIYFIIFMVIYLGLQINVMDRIYWSVTLFGRALNNVPELYHVDIWGEARAEYENFGGLSVPYRENFLKENIKVKLFFPNKGKLVRVRTNVYCSEKLLLNFNIEFNLLERKIIYQPLEIVDLSEASGNDRHYYDAKNLNTFLCEYNITEEKIAEYQEYVLYDVVLRTWVEANGGIYWLEKMKLENCTVDNTFQFSTNNTQSDSEKADNIKWSKELISEETENPYSTETDIGYYLYDMFEANRGGYTGGYWFNEKENMLTYEKTHNSEMNESAYLYWKINLTTIDEETQFAKNFNKYHKRLYKTCKREMVKVQDEAIHTCDMNSVAPLSA